MDEASLTALLKAQDTKLNELEIAVEKIRRYMFWGLISQLALILLPILALMVAIPFLLSMLGQAYEGLL